MPHLTDQHERYIAIWAKAVDTQMHFNEMCVKSRQLGLTFVAAALGTGIVLLSRGDDFAFPIISIGIFSFQIHVAVIILLGGWAALAAVRELDLNVYHKMLRGAVTFGEDFEENYMKQVFSLNKGMTQAVSHFSRYADAKTILEGENKKYEYEGNKRKTAEEKIHSFYNSAIMAIWVGAIALFIVTNIPVWFPKA